MAEEDDLYYLQPGFDLQSLTVPRLRNILVSQNVAYPSSSKKGQLVELVENEILPRSKKLLRERDRVRRTSKGITDMSSQEGTIEGDEDPDRELMPPPPAPKTPRSRKSKSNLGDTATPSTSRRSKTSSTRKSSSKARASDTETDRERLSASARKSRKSMPDTVAASAIRVEKPVKVKREEGASPFSDDNPFQSGSSPPSESRRVSSASRNRKSQGRQSTSRRRETTSPIIKREDDVSSHATYRIPISQLQDEVPTTEEFTPDATRELQQEANGQLVPKRSQALARRKKKSASKVAKSVPGVVLTAVLGTIAAWYRQEKINIGYCGVGQPTWSLSSNPNIPAWVHENLQPTCEPCPPHAICYPDMEVKCENDFVLQHHPLHLNGLVPIPPTCEPDSEKERRIKAVADKAIEELRERRAAYECGDELGTEQVRSVVKAGETKLEIPEETLKHEVSKMRRKGMSSDEFEDLWRGALGDVISRDEVEVIRDG
jgi:Man1-Src1p-C-terminal domain/HeH/LEM domain